MFFYTSVQTFLGLKQRYRLFSFRLAGANPELLLYQHSKTEFAPFLLSTSTWDFPPCFCTPQASPCSPAQYHKCVFRNQPTICVSIKATPWVRQAASGEGLVILVPSAVLGLLCRTWVSDSPLCFILLQCMNLNNLVLGKLIFEGSAQGKRALPGEKQGENT